jgi:hypothetical protein
MTSGKLRYAANLFHTMTKGTGRFPSYVEQDQFQMNLVQDMGVAPSTAYQYLNFFKNIPIKLFPLFLEGHVSWNVFLNLKDHIARMLRPGMSPTPRSKNFFNYARAIAQGLVPRSLMPFFHPNTIERTDSNKFYQIKGTLVLDFNPNTGDLRLNNGWHVNVYDGLFHQAEKICEQGIHRSLFSYNNIEAEIFSFLACYLRNATAFKNSRRGGFIQLGGHDFTHDQYIRRNAKNMRQLELAS